ncbi:MAG: response regulator transcription factor [Halanaerobiales bacterium]|nr:response regulator transcription factor [Halanaerobiales bacterium]
MRKIKIIIFDKNKLYKELLSHFLKEKPEVKSVFSISQFEHVSSVLNKFYPDLVLINMLNLNERELIKIIAKIKRKRKNILIFLLDNNKVNLDVSINNNIDQIISVSKDYNYFYKSIKKYINSDTLEQVQEESKNYRFHNLTERELDVMKQISKGKSNREIAKTLIITERTVKNHVSNILKKLSANDRTQALIKCIKKGIVEIE